MFEPGQIDTDLNDRESGIRAEYECLPSHIKDAYGVAPLENVIAVLKRGRPYAMQVNLVVASIFDAVTLYDPPYRRRLGWDTFFFSLLQSLLGHKVTSSIFEFIFGLTRHPPATAIKSKS